jgi:DNA helicase-2/ATP-dependent DNA helicase PcrA
MNIKLREGQKQVMEYEGGYMAVPSVPGAGKTFTLAQLATKLIGEGRHLPGKILIVTYMNSAVANFRQRISENLSKAGLNPVQGYDVMTLHSLAMKILRDKPERLLVSPEYEILDEVRQVSLIKDITLKWIGENEKIFNSLLDNKKVSYFQMQRRTKRWRMEFSKMVVHMISYFKCMGYEEDKLKELVGGMQEPCPLRWCVAIYQEYLNFQRSSGHLDFDDILRGALILLRENPDLLKKYQDAYTYIFEDESQDSTPIQQEILLMLSQEHGNLLRVGDSNQAIMSTFTVSDPKLFQNFCREEDTKVQSILVASRSCEHIINMANYFVQWAINCHPSKACRDALEEQYIKPVGKDDPFPNPRVPYYSVACRCFSTLEREMKFVADNATRMLHEYPDKTIAVLVPYTYRIGMLVEFLENKGTPYREITRYPKERTYTSRLLGALLDYLACPYDNRRLVEAVELLIPFEDGEGEELIDYLSKIHLEEMFYPLTGKFHSDKIPKALKESGEWEIWERDWQPLFQEFLEFTGDMPEYLVLHIAQRLNFDREQMAIAQKIASDMRYLMSVNPGWSLMDLAQELKEIQNSFNFFASLVYDMQGYQPKPGEVTISTYHKAKGLEWDIVFLTSISSGDFPATMKDGFQGDHYFLTEEYRNPIAVAKAQLRELTDGVKLGNPMIQARIDTICEKIRLLYVGITRAKENLVLTAHNAFSTETGYIIRTSPSLYFRVLSEYVAEEHKQNLA